AAMKAAAERVDLIERARNGLASERTKQRDHRRLGGLDNRCILVEHQYVHRDPVADVARRRRTAAHGRRRLDDTPAILGEQTQLAIDAWARGIDQHESWPYRNERRVDMRRQRLAKLDAVNPKFRSEVALQPCSAECIADKVGAPEDVAAKAREAGGIEGGF